MPYFYLLAYINFLLISLAVLLGGIRFRRLDQATKIFWFLLVVTLIEEAIAYYCAIKFHQNIPVLRVYSIVEVLMISLYFNYSIKLFQRKNIGIYIAVLSLLIGLADCAIGKPLKHFSSFFMYYEGVIIITMSLISLVQLIKSDPFLIITSVPHFWISCALIIFWSFTILNWAFYDYFTNSIPAYKLMISYSICGINYVFYLVITFILFRYPKMYKSNV